MAESMYILASAEGVVPAITLSKEAVFHVQVPYTVVLTARIAHTVTHVPINITWTQVLTYVRCASHRWMDAYSAQANLHAYLAYSINMCCLIKQVVDYVLI